MGEKIQAGNFEFFVEMRSGANDGGPSLQLRAETEGKHVQLLRFDMFRVQPHYHYDPSGKDIRYNLDPLTFNDGLGWVIGLIDSKLEEMVAKAGYEELATAEAATTVREALPDVERCWREISQEPAVAH